MHQQRMYRAIFGKHNISFIYALIPHDCLLLFMKKTCPELKKVVPQYPCLVTVIIHLYELLIIAFETAKDIS